MKGVILLFLLFVVSKVSFAGAFIPKGTTAESLPAIDKLTFGPSNFGGIITGALDPSVVAVDGNSGMTYQNIITGEQYIKRDIGLTTNWVKVVDSGDIKSLEAITGTCLFEGGTITKKDNDEVNISAGSGYVVYPMGGGYSITPVSWPSTDLFVADLTTQIQGVYVNNLGVPFLSNAIDVGTKKENIFLGEAATDGTQVIDTFTDYPVICQDIRGNLYNYIRKNGFIKSGLTLSAGTGTPSALDISAGNITAPAINFKNDINNPDDMAETGATGQTDFVAIYKGPTDWVVTPMQNLDFTQWNDIDAGTLNTVPANNDAVVTLIFYSPRTRRYFFQYPQRFYTNFNQALERYTSDPIEINPNLSTETLFLGYLITRKDADDLSTETDIRIISSGKNASFGAGGLGGGGTDLTNYVQTAEVPDASIVDQIATWASDTAKSIKRSGVTALNGILKALTLKGDGATIQHQNQYGDSYDAANSNLTGGATTLLTADDELVYGTGSLATSYFVMEPKALKTLKPRQAVSFHMSVEAVEASVVECFVYDDDTDAPISSGLVIGGSSNAVLEYSIPFDIPAVVAPSVYLRCNQTTTTPLTDVVLSEVQWTSSDIETIQVSQDVDFELVKTYANAPVLKNDGGLCVSSATYGTTSTMSTVTINVSNECEFDLNLSVVGNLTITISLNGQVLSRGSDGAAFANSASASIVGQNGDVIVLTSNVNNTNSGYSVTARPALSVKGVTIVQTINRTSSEKTVGSWFGCPLYEKSYEIDGVPSNTIIDATLTNALITPRNEWPRFNDGRYFKTIYRAQGTIDDYSIVFIDSAGIRYTYNDFSFVSFTIQYTKNSECP